MKNGPMSSVVRVFRRVATPLAWYYAVTLALPLANGAAQAGGVFAEHALVVLVVPLLLLVIAGLISGVVFGHKASTEGAEDRRNNPVAFRI
jgi:hypothetical protein